MVIQQLKPSTRVKGRWLAVLEDGSILRLSENEVADFALYPGRELTEEERDVMAHFKNPAMPSVAVTADAAIKIATARQEFASTDTFLEMIGFDQADIRRIRAQEQRARGQALLMEMDDADNDTDVE